jgi:ATP-dependent protease ClpP protease subunit
MSLRKAKKRKRAADDNDDGESDDEDETTTLVETIENHIYFYCDVSQKSVFELIKAIQKLNNRILSYSAVLDKDPHEIVLHINSDGGCLFSGLAAVDHILSSRVPITTIVEGCAASAATLMSIVGKKRLIRKHASMLIHQLSSGMWGKLAEMEDDMKNNHYLEKKTIKMYKTYSKLRDDKLNKCLKHDLWWSAKKCVKYGLCDEIV